MKLALFISNRGNTVCLSRDDYTYYNDSFHGFYIKKDSDSIDTPEKLRFFSAFKTLTEELQRLDNQCELSVFQKMRKLNVNEILSKLSNCIHPKWISGLKTCPKKAFFDKSPSACRNSRFFRGNTLSWPITIQMEKEKNTPLKDCVISDANLTGCKFSNTTFKNVNLNNVDLFEVNRIFCSPAPYGDEGPFSGSYKVEYEKASFINVTFDNNTTITLSSNFIDKIDQNLDTTERGILADLTFNHLKNQKNGSILTTIHSFPDERLKISLMEQVFQKVLASSYSTQIITSCYDAFIDIVSKDDDFYLKKSELIKKAVSNFVMR